MDVGTRMEMVTHTTSTTYPCFRACSQSGIHALDIPKAATHIVTSVRVPVRMTQLGSHWTDFH